MKCIIIEKRTIDHSITCNLNWGINPSHNFVDLFDTGVELHQQPHLEFDCVQFLVHFFCQLRLYRYWICIDFWGYSRKFFHRDLQKVENYFMETNFPEESRLGTTMVNFCWRQRHEFHSGVFRYCC